MLEKKPFVNYTLDEDKIDATRKTLNISFNKEEYAKIQKAQQILNIKLEGTAVKMCFEIGLNVLVSSLGEQNLIYLTSKKRTRLDD
jgi:predicted adenine nucleotide alpha hydrolase (AANH) superfamily ATPase